MISSEPPNGGTFTGADSSAYPEEPAESVMVTRRRSVCPGVRSPAANISSGAVVDVRICGPGVRSSESTSPSDSHTTTGRSVLSHDGSTAACSTSGRSAERRGNGIELSHWKIVPTLLGSQTVM